MWTITGWRGRCLHDLFRSYDEVGCVGDPADALGKELARLAGIRRFGA